jgi:endonuclease YncB( thermonuclease family)
LTALSAAGRLSAVALLATGCAGGEPAIPPRPVETVVVGGVTDGDTLHLRDGRRIRLLQIDAPEQGECFARQARRILRSLTPIGTVVELEADPLLDERDEYGRLLLYVRARGRDVNVTLVDMGAAVPYFFRGERGRHAARLLRVARAARAARRGLWGACPAARLAPTLGAVTAKG